MNGNYTCIIVDDDEIDRLTTVSYCRKYSFLKIAGIYADAEAALNEIHLTKPDVLFLDIDMPEISGLELRQKLSKITACIFITSYPDYAVESFELAALDFMIKPIKADRFDTAMRRLHSYLEIVNKSELFDYTLGADCIYIKEGNEQIKLSLRDIIYLEALKDYTSIVTKQKKYCVLSGLGNLLKEKDFTSFVRIHRSFAVQKHFITKVASQQVTVSDISLPIGRLYKDSVAALINNE